MNQMNMAGMTPGNPTVRAMMNNNVANGIHGRLPEDHEDPDYKSRLHTYIYDYFLEQEMWDCARSLKNSDAQFEPALGPNEVDMNGADEKMDSKDNINVKKPGDLPRPVGHKDEQGGPFLLKWFEMFWDIYWAQRKHSRATPMAANLVQLTQAQARRNDQQQQQQQQQQMMRPMSQMMPGAAGMDLQQQAMMRTQQMMGMNNPDLRQRALVGNRFPPNQQQIAQMMRQQQAQQQQQQQQQQQAQMLQNTMRREGVDMNGQRPRTPSGADHAPSPSKRQRLDGVPYAAQPMMPNGRGMAPGVTSQHLMQNSSTQQANQLLMENGINPGNLSDTQFASFQQQNPTVQQKSIQVYAQNMSHQRDGLSKAGGMSDQGSPMIGPGMELGAGGTDFFANNAAAAMQLRTAGMPPQPGANGGGNHALQDYQMQLMLLEQQNKKRLLMARQEQDTITKPDGGQPPLPGQGGFANTGMSPQGSRGGPSPQPDQIRRGTPKMGQPGMPGSPMPDARMAGSPAMNFNNMDPQMYTQLNGGMRPPPSSNPAFNNGQYTPQMEAMQRAQATGNRMPNGNWPQGPQGQPPMVPQPQPQQQPAQIGTPGQRNEMPPPQAVPANNNNGTTNSNNNGNPGNNNNANSTANGRPSSPAPAQSTPQPANKPIPKKKEQKDRKKTGKKNTTGSVAPTPTSEADNPPATPTASTPITPSHPNSFATKPEGPNQPQAAPNAAPSAPAPMAGAQPDGNSAPQYANMEGADQNADFALHFNPDLSDPNLLENFDFEQFLQGDAFSFEAGYDQHESLEAATGMGEG